MDRFLCVVAAMVLMSSAVAWADLCPKCKGQAYTKDIGKCVECGGLTSSGAFKLCLQCSAKLSQCEHCRAALPAAGVRELQARDVAAVLDAGDVNGLKALIARHPRLPEAVLTEDGTMVLAYAAATGNTNTVAILVDAKAPLNSRDKFKRTALYMAVANERQDAALQLIAAGADTTLGDAQGATPLHLTAKQGLSNVASNLVAHGADVNARSPQGSTPLATAAYFGQLTVVQLLCEKSANINDKNADGATVLHYAAQSKKPEVVRYLLGKGANRDAKDSGGKTPADWARSAGSPEVEALLRESKRP